MSKVDNFNLAMQLRCPSGSEGEKLGDVMFKSNINMIYKTIDRINLEPGDRVLEFGFGNAKHLDYLFKKQGDIEYIGFEISQVMIEGALKVVKELGEDFRISLLYKDSGPCLDLGANILNHCFCVNVIYFWDQPSKYLQEIYRVLKADGSVVMSFVDPKFAETLPFVVENIFNNHKIDLLIRLMTNIGFRSIELWRYHEEVKDKMGNNVVRPYVILQGRK
ncbi:class I SAM-dependent methyltransferase [Myroides pelagicus]|uniref:Methyltransferase domain-containing protein n=1 Tax=Myroides pelagicus TaxID=270914 RepID=A0A7K1GJK9_9FLAO|nr:methyltransferase domain-containing protein [Myroides pelagicus]MEC4114418.1 methyltransferase domain-containing protein [Myroides pelagicus]MTH28699.1 methyltransferase domain-containing protein [Myroides pelagicus]